MLRSNKETESTLKQKTECVHVCFRVGVRLLILVTQ